jgi:hypothetical protein
MMLGGYDPLIKFRTAMRWPSVGAVLPLVEVAFAQATTTIAAPGAAALAYSVSSVASTGATWSVWTTVAGSMQLLLAVPGCRGGWIVVSLAVG